MWCFTNLEGTVARRAKPFRKDAAFLLRRKRSDALTTFVLTCCAGRKPRERSACDGYQETLREADARKIAHAGTGNNVAEAVAPGICHTPKGTIALIGERLWTNLAGSKRHRRPPGCGRASSGSRRQSNEAFEDLPARPVTRRNQEDAQRILQSIREARQHADLVVVYQHNHVFANHPLPPSSLKECRTACPNDWLKKWACRGGCRCGHCRDAWRTLAARH